MLQDYEFSMHLGTALPAELRAAARRFDLEVPAITHDGIDIGSEKGGSARYCDRGTWIDIITGD
jgi:hypothetical protein